MNRTITRIFLLILFPFVSVQAQEILTLDACYQTAEENYPLQKKSDLLSRQMDIEKGILFTQKLPKLELAAQATYQSDVISLPITLPNMSLDIPNQEQWKATVNVNQLLYNGGVIGLKSKLKEAETQSEKQVIAVAFHNIKQQINQLYFSILLIDKTQELLQNNRQQLREKITEIQKRIGHGVAPENADGPLQVKVLELQQKIVESSVRRTQLIDKLGLLLGKKIPENTVFEQDLSTSKSLQVRPELQQFELKREIINRNEQVIRKKNYPKIMAFGTAGIGNPGLNMLDNSVQDFYIIGARLQWNVFDWHSAKKQRQILEINKEVVDNQQEVFEWQQEIAAKTYQSDIDKYQQLLHSDRELIDLHKKNVQTAENQLKHDLITPAAYTAAMNKMLQAEINQKIHEIQLRLAQANYQITMYN